MNDVSLKYYTCPFFSGKITRPRVITVVALVVINNGHETMPFPSIEIAANSNIPPRIIQILADGQVLTSQSNELPDITIHSGRVEVQLPGKAAGIYILE